MAENSKPCCVEGCNRFVTPESARGMCAMHYQRWRKHGDPLVSLIDRENSGNPCRVPGCTKRGNAKGLCPNHRAREKLYGDPEVYNPRYRVRARWIEDHASYKGDDCLRWPFSVNETGRGLAQSPSRKKTTSAPNAMCEMAHGPAPTPKHQAAHSCGNGHLGCVNPKHLSWKLPAENEADKREHGTLRKGTAINTNVLSEADVLAIRASSERGVDLAKRFGVNPAAISAIRKRKVWAWLEGDVADYPKGQKLDESAVRRIVALAADGVPRKVIAAEFGISDRHVGYVLKREAAWTTPVAEPRRSA